MHLRFPAFALLAACAVLGHDSPSDVIDVLSHRLEAEGPSARMLVARAYEYRALRLGDLALADFEAALRDQPEYGPALLGAAEIFLEQGRLDEAADLARRGARSVDEPARKAPYFALLARIETARGNGMAALAAWRAALRSPQPEIDWLLGEAACLAEMRRHRERVDALAAAMRRNPSAVLRRAWIQALVDAGDFVAARREIEAELAEARWRSSWLLLRARVSGLCHDPARQRADAAEALREIESRLNPARPDPQLAAERALARQLLDLP